MKRGRKPIQTDKKVKRLDFYTKPENIEAVGGWEKSKALAKELFENYANHYKKR